MRLKNKENRPGKDLEKIRPVKNGLCSRPGMARKSLSASKPRRPLTAKGKLPEDDPEKHWEIEKFGPIYLKWGTKVGFWIANS